MNFKIKIENVVASAALGTPIKLEKIVANLDGVEYEPEQFPGLVMRLKNPKAAALIFSSGKVVCTGAKSPKEAKVAIGNVVTRLRKLKFKIQPNYKVIPENIVASAQIPLKINLNKIAFTLENTEYEPNSFPGLVYRMINPKVTFLIFGSGKIICTGARTVRDVAKTVEKLYKNLKKLEKTKSPL
ncbi:TATA-box-binding protein [Candidatus Micrarchaeota archaeon RBG_16_36_9]|nr:MAG: TATA-box-binding protein [Candidatus Micrarchaeota archaeon RBG_16_36_9]